MKIPRLLVNAGFVQQLGRATTITLWVVSLVGIGWLVRLTLLNTQIASIRSSVSADKTRAAAAQKELLAAKVDSKQEPLSGRHLVAELQSYVEKAAAQRGCIVSELVSAQETSTYVSQYGGAAQKGWMQVPVRLTLVGTTPAILDTLRSLETSPILYEIITFDAQRTGISKRGDATVTASVDLRLIRKAEDS